MIFGKILNREIAYFAIRTSVSTSHNAKSVFLPCHVTIPKKVPKSSHISLHW